MFSVKEYQKQYSADDIRKVRDKVANVNIHRMIAVTTVTTLAQLIFVYSDVATGFYFQNEPFKYCNIAAEILLFTIGISYTLMGFFALKNNWSSKAARWLYRTYYIGFCIGMMLYVLSDLMRGQPSTTIFYIAIVFSFLPILSPCESLAYFVFYSGCVAAICTVAGEEIIQTNTQVLIMMASSLFISAVFRTHFYESYFRSLDLERANDKLKYMAETDFLTQVPNRRSWQEHLEKNMDEWEAQKKHIGIFLIDIDNFKNFNDTYSHMAGDDCLVSFAETSQRVLTGRKAMFARAGGEEFYIVLEDVTGEDDIISLAFQLMKSMEGLHIPSGEGAQHPLVTISVGALLIGEQGTYRMDQWMKQVDYEVYNAKSSGRNCLSFHGKIYR